MVNGDFLGFLPEVSRRRPDDEDDKDRERLDELVGPTVFSSPASVLPSISPGTHPGFWGRVGGALGRVGHAFAPFGRAAAMGAAGELDPHGRILPYIRGTPQWESRIGKEQALEGELAARAARERGMVDLDREHIELMKAQEKRLAQPPVTKPESLSQEEAQAVEELVKGGMPRLDALAEVKAAGQRETKETPHPGTLNGKPAWGILAPSGGWVDPQTRQSIPGFQPAPTFGELGLYEPIMVQTPDGRMVPGRFNRRTGRTELAEPAGGALPIPIPKEASSQLDKVVGEGTDVDRMYQSMMDSVPAAKKGDQQQMINILTAHVGMTLGQIPGRRLNQEFFREAQSSSPLLQRVEARFDDRGLLIGVVLTPQQIDQMVDLGKQRRVQIWRRLWDTQQRYGLNMPRMLPDDIRKDITTGPGLGTERKDPWEK